ncbi:MAG TPA: UV DNA damage repair endonuclease UvsE [Elusimicrobiales bacterium]|mgnify:CR=1 FL=1|nr:UV DNA damage repair endonuclease UvsE [Elusimicrobiales bacterium]
MVRLGLCCKFEKEPIKFHVATALVLSRLAPEQRQDKLAQLCLANAHSLLAAVEYCGRRGIGCFRINSQVLPLRTHPKYGYRPEDLPGAEEIKKSFLQCGARAKKLGVRLTFHPDQFILLSSPDPEITVKSIEELDYQARVSEWVGADVLNIHAGGAYGDKPAALERVARALGRLPARVLKRLAFENDDRLYTPADLLPFCKKHGLPFVYDVHHHRCSPDKLGVAAVTALALKTWDREPVFHVSSPKYGWKTGTPRPHHDYIDPADFPACWRALNITVEVEAKAKELAIQKLRADLAAA